MKKIIIIILAVTLLIFGVRFARERRATQSPVTQKNDNTTSTTNSNTTTSTSTTNSNTTTSKYTLVAGDYNFSLIYGGLERAFIVHAPGLYDGTAPTALIINFHGGGGNAENQIGTALMNEKSDEAGFIVVYPNGISEPGKPDNRTFNAGNCCGAARDTSVDDIGFVKKMLIELKSKFNIDTKRIYATGYSNGAMLSHRLACEMTDTIAAIASIAGGVQIPECNPSRPIAVLEFHGTDDRSVKYEGGTCGISATGQSYSCKPVEDVMLSWAKRNSCNITPKITYDKGDTTCKTYSSCSNGVEVTLCTIEGGGHTWPGGAYYPDKLLFRKVVGKLTKDISANDMMWDFFKKHPLK